MKNLEKLNLKKFESFKIDVNSIHTVIAGADTPTQMTDGRKDTAHCDRVNGAWPAADFTVQR